MEELTEAVGRPLARAQEAGAVRRDVTAGEVASMMGALCQPDVVAREPARFTRCVHLVCDGLRRDPVPACPGRHLSQSPMG